MWLQVFLFLATTLKDTYFLTTLYINKYICNTLYNNYLEMFAFHFLSFINPELKPVFITTNII